MTDLVVYPSKKKLGRMALYSLAFIFMSGFVAVHPSSPLLVRIAGGYVGIVFCSLCFLYAILRLVKPTPSIVVSAYGLLDNASAIGVGQLAWTEISEVKIYSFMNQKVLGVSLKDPGIILDRQSSFKRILMKINRGLVGTMVNIPTSILPIELEQLLNEIDTRREGK